MQNILLENLVRTRNFGIDANFSCLHSSPMSIHQRIKEKRIERGLTMEALASLVGLSSWQTVQQWEKEGGTAPKRSRLDSVAQALGVTPDWLLFGDHPGKESAPSSDHEARVDQEVDQIIRLIELFKESTAGGRAFILDAAETADKRTSFREVRTIDD